MKNITITLDADIARWVRIQAAEREKSVSRLLRELLQERMAEDGGYAQAMEALTLQQNLSSGQIEFLRVSSDE